MTPEQAWQATIGQLQMEMPKATLDTWVHPTRFLDYEDGVLTLGCHNSYARDWVESRLSSTIRRILIGILAREVELRFEVLSIKHTDEKQRDWKTEDSDVKREPSDVEGAEPDEEVLVFLDTARQSLYEVMTQPERVTVIPGYFLRWIPYLGHQKSWLVVALWQAFYQTFGQKVIAGKPFSVSGAEIARWSGLSRRTVVTHLNDLSDLTSDNLLSWFFDRIDPHQRWGENTGLTSQFCFRLAMPLTPGDASHFTEVLLNLGIRENPIHALKKALELQPKELLPFPAPIQEKPDNLPLLKPRPVQQIILETSGITPQSLANPEIVKLGRELAARLMPPKDVLVLSHYYLLHWLPLLGSGPAWLVALLRDEGYYDRKTGELRDKIRLNDGYARLAAALGIERENTIGDWLPTPIKRTGSHQAKSQERQERRETTRKYVAQFLHKTDYFIDYSGKQKTVWNLQIKLNEPLTPEHQEIHDGLLEVLRQTIVAGEEARLKWLLDGQAVNAELKDEEDGFNASYDANCTGQKLVRTRSSQGLPRELHRPETGQNANFTGSSRVLHRSNRESQRDFHTLKHLINKHFKKGRISFLEVLTTALRTNENKPEKAAGVLNPAEEEGDLWNFDRLLELDGTTERRRREICKTIAIRPILGQRFLSWLFYAYAHRKTDAKKTGIESPFGYALSRFEKLLPAAEYMAIANHSPNELRALLLQPHRTWELPKSTQNILKMMLQNGFLALLDELCKAQTC